MTDAIIVDGRDDSPTAPREWLVTNGLGGYASQTVTGLLARAQHGLFVPGLPAGRHVVLSALDDGLTEPSSFTLRRGIPTWRFSIDGRLVERTVVMPHARNTVCVCWRLLEGAPLALQLRPYPTFRRIDEPLLAAPRSIEVDAQKDHLVLSYGAMKAALGTSQGAFVASPRHHDVTYLIDHDRGYASVEVLSSPGFFNVVLADTLTFVATMGTWCGGDLDGAALIAGESARKAALVAGVHDDLEAQLVCAADQFIARRDTADSRTVMAGYPWFADWGRDTMISLEGLTLSTGRVREGGAILRTFARYVKDGLLPNLFPEGQREALYHTVDATLWYFHALERYRRASGDEAIVRELYPVLSTIVERYTNGTRYGIGLDDDGLVRAGAPGYQLTWMDAKVDDWVVTPRRGKPVEIQALWFNALSLLAAWSDTLGEDASSLRARAERARVAFDRRYVDAATGGLYDLVDGEDGPVDARCRPNQIFALSLDHPILDRSRWDGVLAVVERELLTPYGLRTLARGEPEYHGTYEGTLRQRDAAYHQGTVWPWLLGHYIDAHLRVRNDKPAARALLAAFPAHLRHAGIGTISEIFDGDAPHTPRGCFAQAWSVAEILRAWIATR